MSQSGLAGWKYAALSASTIVFPDPAQPRTRWVGNYDDTMGKLVFTELIIKELYGCGGGTNLQHWHLLEPLRNSSWSGVVFLHYYSYNELSMGGGQFKFFRSSHKGASNDGRQ